MNKTPSFTLPPCPVCSSLVAVSRPMWRLARHTTQTRGRNCYMFAGCQHAVKVGDQSKILDDPAEWSLIESAWAMYAEQLFEDYTKGWTANAIDGFKRALGEKMEFIGTTRQLDLTEADPPEQFHEHPEYQES